MSKGIIYILIATLVFSVMNVFAKELSNFHPLQVVFFRAFGTFVFVFPYMLYKGISIKGSYHKALLARGILGVLSLALFFIAVQRIPLGSAISIRYLGPIFGAMMAAYYLREKINRYQWFSFVIAFGGVIIIKGFDLRVDTLSLVILLFSAVFVGGVFVLIRYLSNKEHPLTIINYFMMCSLVLSLFFVAFFRMPISSEWIPVIGIGLFGLIGQVTMTVAFKTESTSILAPFKYMELVYAMIMGYYFFGEKYNTLPMFGIILIMLGMLLNVWAKRKTN